jgi:hypothetical protein
MEDLKKIQEFFSKPINEVGEGTAGSYKYNKSTDSEYKTEYTFTTDSGLNYIVEFAFSDPLDLNVEKDEAAFVDFYVKSDVKGNEFTQVVNKGELFKVMATVTTIIKEFLSTRKDIKTLYIEPSKSFEDDERRSNLYKKYIEKNLDTEKYSVDLTSGWEGIITIERNENINENQNDPIDSIKMDVPLFLRSLEYAREDAKDDMDLHDFTEKAIQGTKQKGTLSMADYDDLTRQKIKEIIQQVISEKKTKRDRCLRIADRKFDKPSAYKSGAVVRCRKGDIWKDLKEEQMSPQEIISKIKTYRIPYKEFNQKMKTDWIPMWKEEYGNDIAHINELVARHLLYQISEDLFGGVEEIEFANKSKNPTNHFQMNMYLGDIILWTSPFIYVDNNHKAIARRSEIKVLNNDYDDIGVLKEDESLHKWFKRSGTPGKEGGWVDCNAPIRKDGKITGYKSCGRKEGEKRSKYPSCRPTPAKCKDKGKGKTWGKTK